VSMNDQVKAHHHFKYKSPKAYLSVYASMVTVFSDHAGNFMCDSVGGTFHTVDSYRFPRALFGQVSVIPVCVSDVQS
jgi:hypothetical protein